MIRADWATPPDGDFARYVDQLMARAAQARLQASSTPVDGFDGASHAPGMPTPASRAPRAGTLDGAPGRTGAEARPAWADALVRGARRWASPAGATAGAGPGGWSGWLRERVRDVATAPPPATGAPPRQYDARLNRSPRKQ